MLFLEYVKTSIGDRIGNTTVAYFAWKQDFCRNPDFLKFGIVKQKLGSPATHQPFQVSLFSPTKCIYQRVVRQNLFGKFIKINCFCLPKLT